ncbi:MAG: glycerol-3-phosphate 1-O-acyltransferase PlsY [Lachnospiraceae bacterium]|nr:glycerol-3-phosphate 1-O-acyltransferase PlsY [Lachnospiraceae bacterium]
MLVARIIALLIGYAFGLCETGYIYGKIHHTDIREHGSGNAGTTNALRTFGVKGGLLTLLGDILKAVAAILIVWLIFKDRYPDGVMLLKTITGLGTVLGHNFPFFMRFKGGKGIACTGATIIMLDLRFVPILLVVFILAVAVTKYVSLGSIIIVVGFFVEALIFGNMGWLNIDVHLLNEFYLYVAIMMLLALWRHKENIKKLLNGTERKISFTKHEEE